MFGSQIWFNSANALSAVAPACSGDLISTTGLQFYYKMDGDVTDSSGNGYNGTANSITYTDGYSANTGSASVFVRANSSYIAVPDNNYGISTNWSFTAWVRTTDIGSGSAVMIFCGDNIGAPTTIYRTMQIRVLSNNFYCIRFDGSNNIVANFSGNVAINDDAWHHCAVTFDNTVGTVIYTDGLPSGTSSNTTNNSSYATPGLFVGCSEQNGAPEDFFEGDIDDLTFWNRTLSAAEISTIANSTCPVSIGYASGGTITESGSYTIHTFTASGTFEILGDGSKDIEYLVVGGGGSGKYIGGGGAGGLLQGTFSSLSTGAYTMVVGTGGGPYNNGTPDLRSSGNDSTFNGLTAFGGGFGGNTTTDADDGGSGGGSSGGAAGTGTVGQGNDGGSGQWGGPYGGGGGGGAGAAGTGNSSDTGGAGGLGITSSITGTAVGYAGGGGGGSNTGTATSAASSHGGGVGGSGTTDVNTNATQYTGGGGGGNIRGIEGQGKFGGEGADGIIVVRYLT